jgi:hypothetical protein
MTFQDLVQAVNLRVAAVQPNASFSESGTSATWTLGEFEATISPDTEEAPSCSIALTVSGIDRPTVTVHDRELAGGFNSANQDFVVTAVAMEVSEHLNGFDTTKLWRLYLTETEDTVTWVLLDEREARRIQQIAKNPPANPVLSVMTVGKDGKLAGSVQVNVRGLRLEPPDDDTV